MTDEQGDDGDAPTTDGKKNNENHRENDGKELLKVHGEQDTDLTRANDVPFSEEEIRQMPPDHAANHMDNDYEDDQTRNYVENDIAPIATEMAKLGAIYEHASAAPATITMSEYLASSQRPPSQEKVSPSERYKPRPALNALPVRPSLIRACGTYDSGSTDDSERKSSKRVSFQQSPTTLYTPPNTMTSSPISPTASPQLPLRTILAKPPPVSIPPGQYTPIALSSPSESHVCPLSQAASSKIYTCLVPQCDSCFDNPYDRDRHECQQHTIGDPLYSECPVCHQSCSGSPAVHGGFRELLIAHMNRRHRSDMGSCKDNILC